MIETMALQAVVDERILKAYCIVWVILIMLACIGFIVGIYQYTQIKEEN